MTEKLIPLLRNIKTKEPSVTLAALAVYAEMGKGLGHEVIASEILPSLWPMAVGVLLSLDQVFLLLFIINSSLIGYWASSGNLRIKSSNNKRRSCKS